MSARRARVDEILTEITKLKIEIAQLIGKKNAVLRARDGDDDEEVEEKDEE